MTQSRHKFKVCRRSLSNRYDHLDRRVQKITPAATHTYFYDGWMLIKEIVANTNGTTDVIEYHWGKDLSGTIGGAGGVGGLLYLSISNSSTPNSSTRQLYVPWYDAYGNVMGYWDAQGNVVAEYTYDAFGKLISSSGPMADVSSFRYSTKYYDPETGLYYYGYRFYSPELMRWLTRDPIGEEGGVNLYAMCGNNPVFLFDAVGQSAAGFIILPPLLIHPYGDFVDGEIVIKGGGREIVLKNPDYNLFAGTLSSFNDQSINLVEFRGHGSMDDNNVGIMSEPFSAKSGQNLIVNGSDVDIITPGFNLLDSRLHSLLRPKMKKGGVVFFKGCNTARGTSNISETLSKRLPCVYVKGYTWYSFAIRQIFYSPENRHFNSWSFVTKTYFNGKEQK